MRNFYLKKVKAVSFRSTFNNTESQKDRSLDCRELRGTNKPRLWLTSVLLLGRLRTVDEIFIRAAVRLWLRPA